jgi:hypothetical protein
LRIGEEPSRALLDSAILRCKAASPWPRTVCESAGERWHNGAGSLPDLGYPVTPMLVCMLAWAVDGTDFRASRSGGESEPAAAHSLNGCGRAMAQRRGQFAGPSVSGHTDACTHIGAGGRRNRFRASRSGGGSVRDAAHGLGEWPRAMARRRRLLPDLRISAPSVVARILVWARDATDFRPSMNGVGGACASRRTLWESSRERWRDGVGCCRTLGFRPPSVVARILARVGDATDFRPSMNGVGGATELVIGQARDKAQVAFNYVRQLPARPDL